jgi:hypothetical protein
MIFAPSEKDSSLLPSRWEALGGSRARRRRAGRQAAPSEGSSEEGELQKRGDPPLLAQLNYELVRDEGADNPMTLTQLQERMRGWLRAQYRAVLFEEASTTAEYKLFRSDEEGIHLRHFSIARSMRRRGEWPTGIQILLQEVWRKGGFVTVEVLQHNESALGFWRAHGFIDHARTLKISTQTAPHGELTVSSARPSPCLSGHGAKGRSCGNPFSPARKARMAV